MDILVKRHFEGGPLDGFVETVRARGIELDLARTDGAERAYHYKLASTPPDNQEPLNLRFRFVGEFDPRSDYVEQIGEARFAEILDPQPEKD